MSLHELEYGVLLVERRDERQGALLREWLEASVVPAFGDRVLALSADIARAAAGLHVPGQSVGCTLVPGLVPYTS